MIIAQPNSRLGWTKHLSFYLQTDPALGVFLIICCPKVCSVHLISRCDLPLEILLYTSMTAWLWRSQPYCQAIEQRFGSNARDFRDMLLNYLQRQVVQTKEVLSL